MAKEKPIAAEDNDGLSLSPDRMAEIRAKVEKKVAADRAKAVEAAYEAKLLAEMRAEQNELTGDPEEDRIVSITIRVSDSATGKSTKTGEELHGIKLNGFVFNHGQTYKVPLHKARALNDIAYRTHVAEQMREDKPWTEFYRKPHDTAVSGRNGQVTAIHNAPPPTGSYAA